MTSADSPVLRAGDRVLFRSVVPVGRGPLERTGTLLADPTGKYVAVQYDDQADADSALVETLTRLP